jgi:hypothetical protein
MAILRSANQWIPTDSALNRFVETFFARLPWHHYPPGTSKWNRIEHRLFCHITQNWRGRPLTDRIAVVELIGATTTKTGVKVECALDERTYKKASRPTMPRWTPSTSPAMRSIQKGTTQSNPRQLPQS